MLSPSNKNMAACKSAAGGIVKRKVPLYWRKSVFPSVMIYQIPALFKSCQERHQYTLQPHPQILQINDEDKQTTLASLDEMPKQLKVIASTNASGDVQQNVTSQRKTK